MDRYFCIGAATAFATGVAGCGASLPAIGRAGEEVMFWFMVTVVVGADLGFPDPDVTVDTVLTVSFSGQNKIARIAMTSRMITMVGQWALVKLHSDDACAVCGTVFAVAGWVCATTGADGAVAGAVPIVGAEPAPADAAGDVFTATGELAGCVAATGAEATGALFTRLCSVAIVFVIATSVLPMPLSVACTAVSCEGVRVVFAAIDAFSWLSVAASAPSVVLNWLICAAESSAETEVTGVLGAVATAEPCEPVPAMDGGIVLGVPASAGGTTPACISRFASVAFATASSCCMAAACAGVSVCVVGAVWACAVRIFPPMLAIATISPAKISNLFMDS